MRPPNTASLCSMMLSGLLLAGCETQKAQLDIALQDDSNTLFWLIPPLVFAVAFGTPILWFWRRSQLRGWSLKSSPAVPSQLGPIVFILVCAIVSLACFAIANFTVPYMDVMQAIANSSFWLFGNLIGGVMALVIGLVLAERLYVKSGG